MLIVYGNVRSKKDWGKTIMQSVNICENLNFQTSQCKCGKCTECDLYSQKNGIVIVPFSCHTDTAHSNTEDFINYIVKEINKEEDCFQIKNVFEDRSKGVLISSLEYLSGAHFKCMVVCLNNCVNSKTFFDDIVTTFQKVHITLVVLVHGESDVEDSTSFKEWICDVVPPECRSMIHPWTD
jgi:hypothetical protein